MTPNRINFIFFLCFLISSNVGYTADYFWVGGDGNWSDIRHWVTTSGGTAQHTSVPSSEDNVYFDTNSFTAPNQTVMVDFPNVFCRDINWTGATGSPRMEGASNINLHVGGSFILIANMQWNFRGNVIIAGVESGFTINTFGHSFKQSLIFDAGGSGSWNQGSDLTVDSTIQFFGGVWRTDGFNIRCKRLFIYPGTNSTIDFSTSYITILGATLDKRQWFEDAPFEIDNDDLILNAANATIEFAAPVSDLKVTGGNSPIQFGTILFSNPLGSGNINDIRWANLQNFLSDTRFRKIVYQNNGYVGKVTSIDDLELAPGKSYIFLSDNTINIESIKALGDCARPIRMITQNNGQQTTFNTSQTQTLEYVNIRGLKIDGPMYTANNASDLGNNEGWNINIKASNDLYWIGDTGNWSDPLHWSFLDGGASSGCIPSASDNVFFTDNSFTGVGNRVAIDVEDALCRSMTWLTTNRNPVISGSKEKNIHLFGSLTLEPNLTMDFMGDFYFETRQPGQTIFSAGKVYPNNVYFNGLGEYILQDQFEVRDTIIYNVGTLKTNDQNLIGERFMSFSLLPRSLSLGNSLITMRTLDSYHYVSWEIDGSNFTLDAGTSTIILNSIYSGGFYQRSYDVSYQYYRLIGINGFKSINHNNNNSDPQKLYFNYVQFTGFGEMLGELNIKTLQLEPGYSYQFGSLDDDNLFEIDTLISNGSCDAYITIESHKEGDLVTFASDYLYNIEYTFLHDIRFKSDNGYADAKNSIGLGNTPGWTIQELTKGRNLYWVGDGGNWHEPAHWSLESGGPGGECIPTPFDNVFIDDKSFTGDFQSITYDGRNFPVECLNFLWTNSNNTSKLELSNLNLYGSIWIRSDLDNFFISDLKLRGDHPDNEIDLRGYTAWSIQVLGKGDWTFINDLECGNIYMTNGQLHLGYGNEIHVQYSFQVNFWATQDVKLIGGQSKLIIDNNGFYVYGNGFSIQPDSMDMELTGTNNEIYLTTSQDFYNVHFSNQEGESVIYNAGHAPEYTPSTFNKLTIDNNGRLLQVNKVDSLLFAPGHSYTLLSGQTQTINEYWRIRGNNCGRIQLRSSIPGMQATTSMAAGEVNGDFIQMLDQGAIGGASFFAGNNSTNVNNSNVGWQFESKTEFVNYGILGQDVVLCEKSAIILNEENSIGASAYEWQDGSTDPFFEVTQPGDYYLIAKFSTGGSECLFIDSIRILEPQEFDVDLGPDQILCAGDTYQIDGDLGLVGALYQWKDGLNQPVRTVDSGGIYTLSVTLTGCVSEDSILVSYVAIPELNIAEDEEFCSGDTFVVDVTNPGASYLWSTGAVTPILGITQTGIYSVQVESNGCEVVDTFSVEFISVPQVFLGNDTLLCEGEVLSLDGSVVFDKVSYQWSDGITGPFRTITEPGLYQIFAIVNQCASQDSVKVQYVEIPPLAVEKNALACEGDTLIVDVTVPGGNYEWNTGATEPVILISSSGDFSIQVQSNGCVAKDSFSVEFITPPVLDLGAPFFVCANDEVVLDAFVENATYLWDNGATTSSIRFNPVEDLITKVRVSFGACSSLDSVQIMVKPLPDISISEDKLICPGTSTILEANTNGDSLIWNNGETSQQITISQAGTYEVNAFLDGCRQIKSVNLGYFSSQFQALIDDTLICDDKLITLNAEIPGATYIWNDGSNGPAVDASEGIYSVEVFDGNCYFRDTVVITTRECTYFSLFVPNIFSPNQDGVNDELQVHLPQNLVINDFLIQVYDRWGTLVYESADPSNKWSGQSQGINVPQGVYIGRVFIDYIDDNGPAMYHGGMDVTILR